MRVSGAVQTFVIPDLTKVVIHWANQAVPAIPGVTDLVRSLEFH